MTFKNIKNPMYLNFITIEDEDYFNEKYPGNALIERMKEGDVNAVLDIFWRLLDNESKRVIRDVKLFRWEGMNEVVVATDNPIEKLRLIISGADEITAIMEAIFGVRTKSNPDPVDSQKKSPTAESP